MKKLFLFFLGLVICLFTLDRLVSFSLDNLYENTLSGQTGGKINYLLKNYSYMPILAIGNSRNAHHIVPEKINKKSYNLSHNGMSLIFHAGLIDQLLNNEEIKIDTIILHIEMHELFSKTDNVTDIQYLRFYENKNDWINKKMNQNAKYSSLKNLFSSYKWNGKVMSILSNRVKSELIEPPKDGYVSKKATPRDSTNVVWDYNRKEENKREELSLNINNEFNELIKHVKELCANNNVELICYTSPIYKPDVLNTQIKVEKSTEYFDSLGIEYLCYFNAYEAYQGFKSIWVWNDSYHLNEKGAEVLTLILKEDLGL